jgi:hypothetical protein
MTVSSVYPPIRTTELFAGNLSPPRKTWNSVAKAIFKKIIYFQMDD